MPHEDFDIIGQVRAAEEEAAAAVRGAEDERRLAVSRAEEQAVKAVADARAALNRELAESRAQAEMDAVAATKEAATETKRLVGELSQVSAERRERAVNEVVEALKSRWQLTE